MDGVGGRVALVTGGALGIGAATAALLVERGARVVLVDRDAAALEATVAGLGDAAVGVVADVTDLASVEAAVARGIEAFGGIDVVVANAGISSYGSVLDVDPELFRRVLDVDVLGVFHTVRAALPAVAERRGYVLVVSSMAAFAAQAGNAAYATSKAGAEQLANAVRLEVSHLGVDVGSAHMCWIDTPMVRDAQSDMPSFRDYIASLPPPLNRVTSVEACAAAFVAGIERRRRKVFVPRWVGAVYRARNLFTAPPMLRVQLKDAAAQQERASAELRRLGRGASARVTGSVSSAEQARVTGR